MINVGIISPTVVDNKTLNHLYSRFGIQLRERVKTNIHIYNMILCGAIINKLWSHISIGNFDKTESILFINHKRYGKIYQYKFPFLFLCEAAEIFAYRESMCFWMDGGDRLAMWKRLPYRAYKHLAWRREGEGGYKADNTKDSINSKNKKA
jgi:hypothetical protein